MDERNERVLSFKQKLLLEMAREHGAVCIGHAMRLYSTPIHASNAIKRLCTLGFLYEDKAIGNTFKYIHKK